MITQASDSNLPIGSTQQFLRLDGTWKDEWYTLDISPQTSPRPRLGKFGAYMPAKYKMYQDCMEYEIKKLNIEPGDYGNIKVIAYFPYPKSTPKKNLLENSPMRKTPDVDNVFKTLADCLVNLKIIPDDNQIYQVTMEKRYTIESKGRILFKLL